MTIDIRATTVCSLGPLISASISDDYIQLNGLIKTQGNCVLKGIITPTIGQYVTFEYTTNEGTFAIPKKLRVLSFFSNPYEQTTSVTLGCTLTYLSDLQEPIDWSQYNDPQNQSEEPSQIVTFPIYAKSAALFCLATLGLTATQMPLTNRFSVDTFSFDSGYVQVLSDLLVSEGYFGYLNQDEILVVSPLNEPIGSAPVLAADDIIAIGDINSGQLPGESVFVSYSSIKLNNPDKENEEDKEESDDLVNWDYSISVSKPQDYQLNAKDRDGNEYEIIWTYAPWTEEYTYYDEWDRVTEKKKYSWNINADFGTSFFSDQISACFGNLAVGNIKSRGAGTYVVIEKTKMKYAINVMYEGGKPLKDKPEGYDEVLEETTLTFEPEGKVHSGLQYNFTSSLGAYFITDWTEFRGSDILTRYRKVKYEKADVRNRLFNGKSFDGTRSQLFTRTYPSNRTTTDEYAAYGYTSRGQNTIAKLTENGRRFWEINNKALRLIPDGVSTNITTGRQIGLQERPSKEARIIDKYTDDNVDPNNGYSTSAQAQMVLIYGAGNATRRVEFQLPYAPDDVFVRAFSGVDPETGAILYNFSSIPSDAPIKARNFGRIQNRLLFGNRHGMNIQSTPDKLPKAPFKYIAIQASGFTGLYVTNGLNWTIDSSGIILSTDAMFWQPVGGTGSTDNAWFPTPPGVATLPSDPIPYNLSPTVLGSVPNVNQ
jgi:hypothetical protein